MLLLLVTAQFDDLKDEEANSNSLGYDFNIEIDVDILDVDAKQMEKNYFNNNIKDIKI